MDESRAIICIGEGELLDEVLRLAGATGRALERVPDVVAARRRWASASLVLLDESAARRCGEAGLARRARVIVVSRGDPRPSLRRHAVAVGAERVVALPDGESWLARALVDAEGVAERGRVFAVVALLAWPVPRRPRRWPRPP